MKINLISLTEEQIATQCTFIKEYLEKEVMDDPSSIINSLLQLSSLGGNFSELIGTARTMKDRDKSKAGLYEAVQSLEKNFQYRISALNATLGYLGKERLASR